MRKIKTTLFSSLPCHSFSRLIVHLDNLCTFFELCRTGKYTLTVQCQNDQPSLAGGRRDQRNIFKYFLPCAFLVTAKFGLHYIKAINHGKTINLIPVTDDFSIKIIAISQAFFWYQICQGKAWFGCQNQGKSGTLQRYRRCCNVLILRQNCVSDTKCCAAYS